MKEKTCCFFGHRKIKDNSELRAKLHNIIEGLINNENIDTFLFGSKSEFNTLCHESVTKIKEKYPHIKRIYLRAEYPCISDEYKAYLMQDYEDTYFFSNIKAAGKAAYIERNYEMIDKSQVCVVYYDPDYIPPIRRKGACNPKSGTKIAYDYAVKAGKVIINVENSDGLFL